MQHRVAGVRTAALSTVSKSVQHPLMHDEKIEYRGFFILWQDPLDGGAWTASIATACPSLFPAIAPDEAIGGRSRVTCWATPRRMLIIFLITPKRPDRNYEIPLPRNAAVARLKAHGGKLRRHVSAHR